MKKSLIVFATVAAALMLSAAPQKGGRHHQQSPQQRPQQVVHKPSRPVVKPSTVKGGRKGGRFHNDGDHRGRLSGHDRRLIDAIENADSLHELRRYLQAAASSHSEDVRMAMVDALEEKGGRSAADLAYFIADPDEDVASAAFSAWSSVLDDVHVGRRARAILETADILRGFSGGLWQTPGAPLPAPAAVPVMQPVATQPVVTQPVAQPATVPAVY